MAMLNPTPELRRLDLPETISAAISVFKGQDVLNDLETDRRYQLNDDRSKLLILFSGSMTFMLDFEEVVLTGPGLLFITPEQASKLINSTAASEVYSISFSSALVIAELEKLASSTFVDNRVMSENQVLQSRLQAICCLMYDIVTDATNLYVSQSLHGLLLTLMSLLANALENTEQSISLSVNPLLVEFRRLLKQESKNGRKPVFYAEALGTSVANLNDFVKTATGASVSEHIQRQVVLEIKRLLFFSELSIKEIGYELGFDDPVYFNRLFKKATGITPLSFRSAFRDRYHKYLHPFYQCTRKASQP